MMESPTTFAASTLDIDGCHIPVLRLVQSALSYPTCRTARAELAQWLSDLALRISSASPASACPCVMVDLEDVTHMDEAGSGLPCSILRSPLNLGMFVVAFVGLNRHLEVTFEMLRFDKVLLCYPDASTAVREIRRHPQPGSQEQWKALMKELVAGASLIRQDSERTGCSRKATATPSIRPPQRCQPPEEATLRTRQGTFPDSTEAKRVLDDLESRGEVAGGGPPETEDLLYRILRTFEENRDWHLALRVLRSLTNFHSARNDQLEMANRCRDGLDMASRLGEDGSVRFFQNCLDSANRRHRVAMRWQLAVVCAFVLGLIAACSVVFIWSIGFVVR